MSIGGAGGGVTNATLKKRAETGANDTVFCTAVLRGTLTTFLKLWPSSLASRSGPAGGGPKGHLNPAIARDTPRIATGFEKANWIHAFWPTGAIGRAANLTKSPSASNEGSRLPLLDVTSGCRSVIGTSPAGTR